MCVIGCLSVWAQVIRLFAQKQPAALRRRLDEIDRDVKLGKVQFEDVAEQA